MRNQDRERSLIRAVELYYYEGMTQAAISERLGCTRWTVGRLLKEAHERGIVQVSVRHPHSRSNQLEKQLVRSFGFKDVRVVPTQPTPAENLTLVAQTAADYVYDIRPRPDAVVVGGGATTAAIARAMPDGWTSGVTIMAATPAPRGIDDTLSGATLRIMAKRGYGVWRTFDVSPITADVEQAERLRKDPQIAATLYLMGQSDLVVYSPDVAGRRTTLVRSGEQPVEEMDLLEEAGAVGVVLNRYINTEGEPVSEDVEARTLGMDLDQVRAARVSIAVGYGVAKRPAFIGIAKSKLANVLVTDSEMAEFMLDTQPSPPLDGAEEAEDPEGKVA